MAVSLFALLKASGVLYPSRYCVNTICIHRPGNYSFRMFATANTTVNDNTLFSLNRSSRFDFGRTERGRLLFSNIFGEKALLAFTNTSRKEYKSIYRPNRAMGNCIITVADHLHPLAKDVNEIDSVIFHDKKKIQITIALDNDSLLPKMVNDICRN
jgi:hypothetical protein